MLQQSQSRGRKTADTAIPYGVRFSLRHGRGEQFGKFAEICQIMAAQKGVALPEPKIPATEVREHTVGAMPVEFPKFDVCKRKVSIGIGNVSFVDLTLPSVYGGVRDYWNGISVGLGHGKTADSHKLATGLLWAIAVNPEAALRQIDEKSGAVACRGPAWKAVFGAQDFSPVYVYLHWVDGISSHSPVTVKKPLPPPAHAGINPAKRTMDLEPAPGNVGEVKLFLYGTHNRLMHVSPNQIGDGSGESFLIFEIIDRCGGEGRKAAIRQYAAVDEKGGLISKQSTFGQITAFEVLEHAEAPMRLPKLL